MKTKIIAAFVLTALFAMFVYGQTGNQNPEQDAGQARDLFKTYAGTGTKGKPGAKIQVELLRKGRREFVPLTTVFQAGDKVKFHFEINFPAYVEIYNQGSSGHFQRLFPYTDSPVQVKARTGHVVPGKANEWFEFDTTAGVERLSLIFSEVQFRTTRLAAKPVKRYEPGIAVNQGNSQSSREDEKQLAISELNQRALDEGRDLNRVKVENEQYVFGDAQRFRRVVGIMVNLNHQ